MTRCDICDNELTDNQCQMGGLHVSCAERRILTYCITINGATEYHKTKKTFYKSLQCLVDEIEDDNDDNHVITITRKYMTEIKYRRLPENNGF